MNDPRGTEWPSIGYESRPWEPVEQPFVPRSARRTHTGPYDSAVVPAIAAVGELGVPDDVLAAADEASTEIARFDAEVGAELAPFSALLLRSESAASSRIEQLTASAKSIALAEMGDPTRKNANVIVANTRAMEAAVALADRLDEGAILDMHAALIGGEHPDWVGRWRDQQVWIGGSNFGPHGAEFVPPHHDLVPVAMGDLVAFMQRDDMPVLVQAALAHAQFETIHPFPDGNGRTGRALIHSLLRSKGLTRKVTFPISAGLLADTNAYFDALTAYRDGDPKRIVAQMADASFLALGNGRMLVAELDQLRASWQERIVARRGAAAWAIAERLMQRPVVDSPSLQRELGVTAPSVNQGIERLVEAGVLVKVSGNHRNRKWAAPEVLAALDAFSERAGRRSRGS